MTHWIYKKILTQWLTGVGNGNSALMEANCSDSFFAKIKMYITRSTFIINGTLIGTATTHCDLGVIVDQNLSWAKHYIMTSVQKPIVHFI